MAQSENSSVILREFGSDKHGSLYTLIFRRKTSYATVPFDITQRELDDLFDLLKFVYYEAAIVEESV